MSAVEGENADIITKSPILNDFLKPKHEKVSCFITTWCSNLELLQIYLFIPIIPWTKMIREQQTEPRTCLDYFFFCLIFQIVPSVLQIMEEVFYLQSNRQKGSWQFHWLDSKPNWYLFPVDYEKPFKLPYVLEKVEKVITFSIIRGQLFVRLSIHLEFVACG